ncbi:MAG: LPS export ABC transporter periplasmic protein LptC [Pseudomonadota bacterium]
MHVELSETSEMTDKRPDYEMTFVTRHQYDRNGSLNAVTSAKHVTVDMIKRTTQWESPRFLFVENQKKWLINAKLAESIDDTRLYFYNGVDLSYHENSDENYEFPLLSMELQQLDIDIQQQIATSNKPVNILMPGGTIQGSGITVNLETSTVDLNKVKGHYEKLY